jgi:small ligand-binding sensory domain FIST
MDPFSDADVDARSIVVRHDNWRIAVDEALRYVLRDRRDGPDLLVMFASTVWSDDYDDLVGEVFRGSHTRCLVGCSARGVISGDDSRETVPGISMLALWLPDAEITPVRLHQAMQDVLAEPDLWFGLHNLPPETIGGWMIFAEPYRMDVQDTLTNLRERYPGTPMVGALTSTLRTDRRMWVFLDDHVYDEGGVAVALGRPYGLEVVVSQGGSPVGEPWTITGVEQNRITTISNRPAIDVLRDTMASLDTNEDDDPPILIGFPMSEYQDSFSHGDFVVRGIMGVDVDSGSIVVGSIPRVGQTVQFHLREPRAAAIDQASALADLREKLSDNEIVAGLLCTCKGRGTAMFGREDHDAVAVRRAFPDLPFTGMFSLAEIGPVGGVPALNGFAMSLGVITKRS